MVDQTVRVEPIGVASVALVMAEKLWFEEFGHHPKLNDSRFIALVSICSRALQGTTAVDSIQAYSEKLFSK